MRQKALVIAVFELIHVALAVELAEDDAAAHAQPEDKAGEQNHQRKRASDGCKGDIAQKAADNQRIGDVIELLKQVARDQRQAEADQPGADGALQLNPAAKKTTSLKNVFCESLLYSENEKNEKMDI